MRAALIVCCAVIMLQPRSAHAQAKADLLQYDAQGRVTHVQSGSGYKSDYAYDPAGNRTHVASQRQFDTNSNAEAWAATSLPHTTGYAQYSGWAADTNSSNGIMTYGPYTNSLGTGSHTAAWKIMVGGNAQSNGSTIVVLDVNDADANQLITSRTLTPASFATPMAYQVFELPFSTTAAQIGHHLEFRTWYFGNAYINVAQVSRY
jgi:YD repeat-containing protein